MFVLDNVPHANDLMQIGKKGKKNCLCSKNVTVCVFSMLLLLIKIKKHFHEFK